MIQDKYSIQSSLKKRNSYKEVQGGDIVVFGEQHVEIITSIENHLIADNGFCSIGAGRGERGSDGMVNLDVIEH